MNSEKTKCHIVVASGWQVILGDFFFKDFIFLPTCMQEREREITGVGQRERQREREKQTPL